MGRKFVVAAWDGPMRLQTHAADEVEADTAEHAVVRVMKDHPQHLPETVYAAWPKDRPNEVVKFRV
jgi:DNA-binding transcriptional LysR family regulator